jgi:hypothetical protein
MTTANQLNSSINEFHTVLNAYTEATKNNIFALQDKYLTPITTRKPSDFSTITGVKINGATTLGGPVTTNVTSASSCAEMCKDNQGCVGALYTETPKSCQLYSSIPSSSQVSYSYDPSSSFISYNNTKPDFKAILGPFGTVNANVMNTLDQRLNTLLTTMSATMSGQTGQYNEANKAWVNATKALDTAEDNYIKFENAKKINKEVNSQLRNSGLDVIRTKTKYILFIAVLLILLAIYVRDFNFSIFICIILFLMISVYGSIFLGAFLLVLIVLYLVYYAY